MLYCCTFAAWIVIRDKFPSTAALSCRMSSPIPAFACFCHTHPSTSAQRQGMCAVGVDPRCTGVCGAACPSALFIRWPSVHPRSLLPTVQAHHRGRQAKHRHSTLPLKMGALLGCQMGAFMDVWVRTDRGLCSPVLPRVRVLRFQGRRHNIPGRRGFDRRLSFFRAAGNGRYIRLVTGCAL